jgi:diguanylate cyclase (GGDEF)-like protein
MSEVPSIEVAPATLHAVSRVIPLLSAALIAATLLGALLFYLQIRRGDEAAEMQHRQALRAATEQLRPALQSKGEIDSETLRGLEQISGIEGLRWETEPEPSGREVQSVLDAQGRILGWLSWEPTNRISGAVFGLLPLLVVIAAGLIGLGILLLWQTRRIRRALTATVDLLHQVSREDSLTGMANTAGVLEALDEALAIREAEKVVTFIFLDLDGFRTLNDSLGRPFGNELLRVVSSRFRVSLPPGAKAGRMGRHKFVFILPDSSIEKGFSFAQELAELAARPCWIQRQGVQLSATVGVAHAPHDGLSGDEILRHATLAMREAKRKSRGSVMKFEPTMEADLQERRFIERELRRALEEKALDLHYQPIVSAEGSRTVGVEALLRWNHPTRGNIPPMDFVPIAERTGIMPKLGEFVLRRALKDAMRWPELYVAINLSPVQVRSRALVPLVSSLLRETGVEPSRVVLEITEGVLMDDPEAMKTRLEELRGLGVRIALDDFGSGFSSLSYLQRFPFDKLKIDRGFVAPLGRFENSAVIIQAIVALGRALGLSVLVEGVETEEQRVLLRLAGCDEMQGYLFAKPAPRETLDKLVSGSGVARPVSRAATA